MNIFKDGKSSERSRAAITLRTNSATLAGIDYSGPVYCDISEVRVDHNAPPTQIWSWLDGEAPNTRCRQSPCDSRRPRHLLRWLGREVCFSLTRFAPSFASITRRRRWLLPIPTRAGPLIKNTYICVSLGFLGALRRAFGSSFCLAAFLSSSSLSIW